VTLDCQGAHIKSAEGAGGRGNLVTTPVDTPLHDVTVRNCHVEGFLNSLRVTRDGFRTLPAGHEYEHGTADILVERSTFERSRGVGVYVDGYVEGITIRDNHIDGAGSSGIYLETGSRRSHVEHNTIVRNGFRENGPGGQPFTFAGTDFWFWGIGREGISVDGSYENTITGNAFTGNSAGGIFLYKNCGEYPDRPAYFERRYPAEHNLIEGNTFVGGTHGIWVGSRMGENTVPMDCTDPAYIDEPLRRVVLDRANDNVLRVNRFEDVTYGIRVEDDGTTVEGNSFTATSPDRHAVVVGTPLRTTVLGHPVTGTRLVGNAADIPGNADPYRWVTGQATPSTRATSPTARPRPCARASSRPARRSSSSSPWRSPVPTAAHPPRNPTSPSRPSAPKPTTSTGCRARRGRRPWPPGWRRRGRPRAGSGARPPGRRCASGRRASR